ncbi:16S rRNA (guanine(527)-N(7))-methyltransferase RsmG [Thermasporomyces composti]|uniref:Ribosomal RNA small subunit methyltransferase G n=1 Tax=Thermasporomyces composti TaxID=696763 RepID=A0A3D9V538_THECX|nr:16S rRNA (guanine(527)-N(7))-methyltransferase RsmG [Thermasporomyces composti]REF36486.1 16S rRNA m(7)G-527 methyltransferase [Thermasporomyces composti]
MPAAPEAAGLLFGSRLPLLLRYAELLVGPGVERGLLGPREVDRLWDRHLLNCAVLTEAIPDGASVCDVGSGAGLPGVVLAIARPDLHVTLLEPLLRRVTFLSEVTRDLGLRNTTVLRARAEEHDGVYDVVTARAVAPLDRLTRVALGLCRPGGSLLAVKGERAAEELHAVEADLPRRGVERWSIEKFGSGLVAPPTTVVRMIRGRDGRASRRGGAKTSR